MGHPDNKTSPPTIDPYTDQSFNNTLPSSFYPESDKKRVYRLSGKEILENKAENLIRNISSTRTQTYNASFRSDVLKITTFN